MASRRSEKRPWQHLYDTALWRKLRERQLAIEPLCQFCKRREDIVIADVVDHIRPHKGDIGLFGDPDNLQSLCRQCHDSVKKRMEMGQTVVSFGSDGWPIGV